MYQVCSVRPFPLEIPSKTGHMKQLWGSCPGLGQGQGRNHFSRAVCLNMETMNDCVMKSYLCFPSGASR